MKLPQFTRDIRWRAIWVTALACLFVGALTLGSAKVDPNLQRAPFTCLFDCRVEGLRDLLSNILLFLPLGWALRHWVRPGRVIGICLLTTIIIEALQATVIVGRDSSLRDIIGNVVGGALGAWLFDHWRALCWPRRAAAIRLGAIAASGWLLVLVGTAIGERMSPTNPPWYGLWTPDLPEFVQYPGKLLVVELDGWVPTNGLIQEPVPLRAAMRRQDFQLTLRVQADSIPGEISPIFLVSDGLAQHQLLVGQRRRALWLHLRNRAEGWHLRPLLVRIPVLPEGVAGDTMTIQAGMQNRQVVLRATLGSESVEARVPLTVGLGWTTMLPFLFPLYDEWLVVSPLWLAAIVFPAAYWFGRFGAWAGLAMTVILLTGGLLVVPLITGASPSLWGEWTGAVAGAALGWGAGLRSWSSPMVPNSPGR